VAPNWLWARWVWQYNTHINTTQSHFGVAEVNGKIVGLTLYDHGLGEAFFCVDMDYEGIKSQLIDFAIDNLNLEVFGNNAPAISLYEKFGFIEEGRKRKAIKTSETYNDIILMGRFSNGK
jgi:RimJ/RimL family protein N-acetyltransferase